MEDDGLLCWPLLPGLRVPITVSLSSGTSWAHLKPCVWLYLTSSSVQSHFVQITIIGFGYDAVSCMLFWKNLHCLLKLFYENYKLIAVKICLSVWTFYAWQPLIFLNWFILFICLSKIKGLCFEWQLYCYSDDVLCFNNGVLFSFWSSKYILWKSGNNKNNNRNSYEVKFQWTKKTNSLATLSD